jgi:antitoxin FitA
MAILREGVVCGDYRSCLLERLYDITMQSPLEGEVMGQILIRNIDDKVLERLKRRAAMQQKSLEQSLRDVLAETARPSRAELLAEADRIAAMTPPREKGKTYPTAEEFVRESRDSR